MRLQDELAASLTDRALTLAIAESCTGGALSHVITDMPGASAYFIGGIIAYHNRIKHALLGVPVETLDRYGAVSRQTAMAMAEGCRERLESDVAVSITGIAGPSGGTPDKPVGLVYVGASTHKATWAVEHRFAGDRSNVRRQAVSAALEMALRATSELD
jgi:nicotinamide-nucleotide amidase